MMKKTLMDLQLTSLQPKQSMTVTSKILQCRLLGVCLNARHITIGSQLKPDACSSTLLTITGSPLTQCCWKWFKSA